MAIIPSSHLAHLHFTRRQPGISCFPTKKTACWFLYRLKQRKTNIVQWSRPWVAKLVPWLANTISQGIPELFGCDAQGGITW